MMANAKSAAGSELTIRAARPGEGALVLSLVKSLAEYEKRSHEVAASAADMERALFGENARIFCDIAELHGRPIGFALYFLTFSTFAGRHGLYLEDLYIEPQMRGRGFGKALLAHLAKLCQAQGWDRLSWSVLTWNEPAIRFYEGLGAERVEDWFAMKLKGEALARLATWAGIKD